MAVVAADLPPETTSLHNHEAAMVNQTKPIVRRSTGWRAVHHYEMLAAIQGGADAARERPIMVMGVCPVSPLKLTRTPARSIIESSRVGLPTACSAWPWRAVRPP